MIKEIWCMMHSHLDVGYTHPQPLLMELQVDYLNQAMALVEKTRDYPEESRFCWTIEANCVLEKWLETADEGQIAKLKGWIEQGRLCVTALPMHTTPGCNARELVDALAAKGRLERALGITIRTAINHDVNGQPWPLGGLLLDCGVDFYLTGINIHFGGIPFPRPMFFDWKMADGRKLRTFLGEHYSLFSQFMFTHEHSTARMHEGVQEYVKRLEENHYPYEFAFLTATNPPLYDNNCPDLELADLIRHYNEEGHAVKIRIVTADMLRERVLAQKGQTVPEYAGDWTDYWNFGSASTARETRVSRLAKHTLQKAEFFECLADKTDAHYESVKWECRKNILLYDEHTWGASGSVREPDSPETASQLVHKQEMAYTAADLSGYLLGNRVEALNGNPWQSNGLFGITLTNTCGVEQIVRVRYPKGFRDGGRQLSALRSKGYVPYLEEGGEMEDAGWVKIAPFTHLEFSFEELDKMAQSAQKTDWAKLEALGQSAELMPENGACTREENLFAIKEGCVETPYYRVFFDEGTGRIRQVYAKELGKYILNEKSGYFLFDPVRETVDETQNPAERATLFPRDVELGNRSISQWNHNWKAKRERAACAQGCADAHGTGAGTSVWQLKQENGAVTFSFELCLPGTRRMHQEITFYACQPNIRMEVSFYKEAVYLPESIYFAVPLSMEGGWQCSYDTAGEVVKLDEEQLGNVCRDWVTVDGAVALYDGRKAVTLACPDAPLVQVGGFHFGQENKGIAREENPLLLAWAMNNYWDTNFCANQQGAVKLAYELNVHEAFRERMLWEDGVHATQPVVIGALVDESAKNTAAYNMAEGISAEECCCGVAKNPAGRTLLAVEAAKNAAVILLSLYPAADGTGIYAMAKNLRDEPELLTLRVDDFPVACAVLETPCGKAKGNVKVEGDKVYLVMPARALQLLKITKKQAEFPV
ncbi:MAG: hypothetical protein K2O03_15645 [Lachnospiraceae bacterium]|nr:hypothetical protein [Lachnospiraceae bacterium]